MVSVGLNAVAQGGPSRTSSGSPFPKMDEEDRLLADYHAQDTANDATMKAG
jgi:hypothetical protein